jgi:signal transduction histidine kinase/ligand-binding sensor domain-containing protein
MAGRIIGTNAVLFPSSEVLGNENVNYISADRNGQIWVGTENKIGRWNGSGFEDETPTNGEASINTTFLFVTATNGLWNFANGMVRHAANRRWDANIESWQNLLKASSFDVEAYEDRDGGVWFRQFGLGLFHARADGTTEQISSANGLPGDRVTCWFQDREGNLWVGIDHGGLVRLRKKQFQTIGAAEGLKTLAVSSICEDTRSNIWIGTFGGGLNCWSGGKLEHFELPEAVNKNSVFSVCPDSKDRLWISADREDLYEWDAGQIIRNTNAIHGIKVILADHSGRVWLGEQSQLGSLTDGNMTNYGYWNGFKRIDVRALAEDRQGALWIGTGNGVLYKFTEGKFTAYKPADGIDEQAIWSLLPDDDGTVWVGTFFGGLLRFKDGKFTRYTTQNGLPNDVICQILDDGLGNLWIGSHQGIFYVPKSALSAFDQGRIQTLPCAAYGLYDGLPTLECSGNYQPSCWRAQDGKLWFATAKGAVTVSPEKIQPNPLPPPVIIEDYFMEGKPGIHPLANGFAPGTAVQIPPGKHQFDFHFTALSFTAPDKVRFRYKLKGFDNDWIEGGTKRSAHYGPLQPGRYDFQVIACNNDGVWNEQGATLTVTQLPFFWQTWWFAGLVGIVIIGSISAAVRYAATRSLHRKLERLKQQQAIERERERIAKDIHDDLGAGLTQIRLQSSLALRESPAQMQTDLAQIAEKARDMVRTMDEIVWAINPEKDTLDELVTYLGKFVHEYLAAARLRCRLDLPAQVPAIAVSSEARHNIFLALKEALNNAMKHSRATEVLFQLKIQAATFTFLIKDNGIGFTPGISQENIGDPAHISSGQGLGNLSKRLNEMGGTCAISSRPGQGTEVALSVPIQNRQ